VDAHAIIAMLRAEQKELKRAIEALERLERLEQSEQLEQFYEMPKSGRGRKSMGAKERKVVSERMTRYWRAWRVRHPHTDDAS
jgi:hypothetical protein